ncbi:MAG TPA: hypothetical protein VGO47_09435 [Chlamydiales bacterium]|nr:hypothetical protein [Chlamydiales bacterium]
MIVHIEDVLTIRTIHLLGGLSAAPQTALPWSRRRWLILIRLVTWLAPPTEGSCFELESAWVARLKRLDGRELVEVSRHDYLYAAKRYVLSPRCLACSIQAAELIRL